MERVGRVSPANINVVQLCAAQNLDIAEWALIIASQDAKPCTASAAEFAILNTRRATFV